MTDFTNTTSQTLDQLRNAEDKLTQMLWNAGDIVQKLSNEQVSREQIEPSVRSFSENAQSVQQLLQTSVANLERISSGLPHEDSCYGSWLDFNLASMRTETIRNKLYELKNNQELQRSRERVKELEGQLAQL
jgi:chromosome segregation ATPase